MELKELRTKPKAAVEIIADQNDLYGGFLAKFPPKSDCTHDFYGEKISKIEAYRRYGNLPDNGILTNKMINELGRNLIAVEKEKARMHNPGEEIQECKTRIKQAEKGNITLQILYERDSKLLDTSIQAYTKAKKNYDKLDKELQNQKVMLKDLKDINFPGIADRKKGHQAKIAELTTKLAESEKALAQTQDNFNRKKDNLEGIYQRISDNKRTIEQNENIISDLIRYQNLDTGDLAYFNEMECASNAFHISLFTHFSPLEKVQDDFKAFNSKKKELIGSVEALYKRKLDSIDMQISNENDPIKQDCLLKLKTQIEANQKTITKELNRENGNLQDLYREVLKCFNDEQGGLISMYQHTPDRPLDYGNTSSSFGYQNAAFKMEEFIKHNQISKATDEQLWLFNDNEEKSILFDSKQFQGARVEDNLFTCCILLDSGSNPNTVYETKKAEIGKISIHNKVAHEKKLEEEKAVAAERKKMSTDKAADKSTTPVSRPLTMDNKKPSEKTKKTEAIPLENVDDILASILGSIENPKNDLPTPYAQNQTPQDPLAGTVPLAKADGFHLHHASDIFTALGGSCLTFAKYFEHRMGAQAPVRSTFLFLSFAVSFGLAGAVTNAHVLAGEARHLYHAYQEAQANAPDSESTQHAYEAYQKANQAAIDAHNQAQFAKHALDELCNAFVLGQKGHIATQTANNLHSGIQFLSDAWLKLTYSTEGGLFKILIMNMFALPKLSFAVIDFAMNSEGNEDIVERLLAELRKQELHQKTDKEILKQQVKTVLVTAAMLSFAVLLGIGAESMIKAGGLLKTVGGGIEFFDEANTQPFLALAAKTPLDGLVAGVGMILTAKAAGIFLGKMMLLLNHMKDGFSEEEQKSIVIMSALKEAIAAGKKINKDDPNFIKYRKIFLDVVEKSKGMYEIRSELEETFGPEFFEEIEVPFEKVTALETAAHYTEQFATNVVEGFILEKMVYPPFRTAAYPFLRLGAAVGIVDKTSGFYHNCEMSGRNFALGISYTAMMATTGVKFIANSLWGTTQRILQEVTNVTFDTVALGNYAIQRCREIYKDDTLSFLQKSRAYTGAILSPVAFGVSKIAFSAVAMGSKLLNFGLKGVGLAGSAALGILGGGYFGVRAGLAAGYYGVRDGLKKLGFDLIDKPREASDFLGPKGTIKWQNYKDVISMPYSLATQTTQIIRTNVINPCVNNTKAINDEVYRVQGAAKIESVNKTASHAVRNGFQRVKEFAGGGAYQTRNIVRMQEEGVQKSHHEHEDLHKERSKIQQKDPGFWSSLKDSIHNFTGKCQKEVEMTTFTTAAAPTATLADYHRPAAVNSDHLAAVVGNGTCSGNKNAVAEAKKQLPHESSTPGDDDPQLEQSGGLHE
jgi:hypothetical protein